MKRARKAHPTGGHQEIIKELKEEVGGGKHWFTALLEAMGRWKEPEEMYRGRTFRYLIGGEAFDWLLLAERLSYGIARDIPQKELEDLLFRGRPPLGLSREEFRRLLGPAKYKAYLNYFYGITVEEALQQAVAEEVRKERLGWCCNDDEMGEEAFCRIYDIPREELWQRFRREKKLPRKHSLRLRDQKEFTYWLFRYRVAHSDQARVASDTKKGLDSLLRLSTPLHPWEAAGL
ncbi:MAG: hypothetical protein KJ624_03800 [Chloroflexi bacterium]|nr:hypothetical protein [Chloroflexota bacterium]